MNPRLRTIPSNSILLLLREIVCECCIAVLTEDDGEKQIASVLIIQFEFDFFNP